MTGILQFESRHGLISVQVEDSVARASGKTERKVTLTWEPLPKGDADGQGD